MRFLVAVLIVLVGPAIAVAQKTHEDPAVAVDGPHFSRIK